MLPGDRPIPDVLAPSSRTTFTGFATDEGLGGGAGSTGCPPRTAALGLGMPVSGLTRAFCVVPARLSDVCVFSMALESSRDAYHVPVLTTDAEADG